MPRRRRDDRVLDLAIAGRWPAAAVLATLCFVVGVWILPHVLASTPAFAPLGGILRTFVWVATLVFASIAAFKFFRESSRPPSGMRGRVPAVERPRQRVEPPVRTAQPSPAANDNAILPAAREPSLPSRPTAWSMELLQSIEWKRFEDVVAAYFRAKNFRCETIAFGADGGVDGRLYFGDLPQPVGIVQCKAWGRKQVGIAPVRELLGVMAHEKVERGYFCATGTFSKEAIAFAATNPITLIGGRDLLDAIARMPDSTQRELLDVSTTGDYTTPTCPSCGIKLVARTIGGNAAWGCRNYPRCRTKIFQRSGDRVVAA